MIAATFTFVVAGRPAPQGSKRLLNRRSGVMVEQSKRVAPWRSDVRSAAQNYLPGDWLRSGPISLSLLFFFARPKAHFNTKGELKPTAPKHLLTRVGDIDKLCRAALDSMSSIVYDDDAQVVMMSVRRVYVDPPDGERMVVTVNKLE
jgi:Holliday junction resolvase RusA-like endonuclease